MRAVIAQVLRRSMPPIAQRVESSREYSVGRRGNASGRAGGRRRLTHRSVPTIIRVVFRQLRAAIVGLSLVPCLTFSAALPQEHRHDAGPDHAYATVHQHFESHDHDGAELSPVDGRVTWLDRVALQGAVFRSFAPVPLAVEYVADLDIPRRWIAVEAIDGAPPHGPPRPALSLRGPPALPSCVI